MKITDFLKKYSLIDDKFIDDFYTFYDEGKNEYDFTICLNKLAYWLEVTKGHLKELLISNFEEDEDYEILKKTKNGKGKGKGGNNTKTIMLTYTCSKLLCMISRSKKADVIRRFYIELEKLVIQYKDIIVKDVNEQLGIKQSNAEIIQKNKKKGLVYVLRLDNTQTNNDDENFEAKIGHTQDLQQRMRQYNVGRVNELPIALVYLSDDADGLEECLKNCLNQYQIKNNTETFLISVGLVKETIKYCNRSKSILLKSNKKLLKGKDDRRFVIIIDTERLDRVDELVKPIKQAKKKASKKRKTSKRKTSKRKTKDV